MTWSGVVLPINMGGDFEEKAKANHASWSTFVTGLNQGFEILKKTGEGLAYLGKQAGEALDLADQFDDLRSGLEGFAGGGANADAVMKALTDSTKGVVGVMDGMQISVDLLSRGVIKNAADMEDLAHVGAVLGSKTGKDAKEGVEQLGSALATLNPRTLRLLGLTIDSKVALEEYARSLGTSVEWLTEAERKTGLQAAVMEKARKVAHELGDEVQLSAKEKLTVFSNEMEKLKIETSRALADAVEPFIGAMLAMAKEYVPAAIDNIKGLGDAFALMSDETAQSYDAFDSWEKHAKHALLPMTAIPDALKLGVGAMKENAAALQANAQANDVQADFVARVNKALHTNFTEFGDAAKAAREHRGEIEASEHPLKGLDGWLEEINKKLAEQAHVMNSTNFEMLNAGDAAKKLGKELGVTADALDLIGLTSNDTKDSLKTAADVAVESFHKAQESGQFSAQKLYDTWVDNVLPAITDGYDEIPAEFRDVDDELAAQIPGATQDWIDRMHAELDANKGELSGPIAEGVEEGFDMSEPHVAEVARRFGIEAAKALAEEMGTAGWTKHVTDLLNDAFSASNVNKGSGAGGPGAGNDWLDPNTVAPISEQQQAKLTNLYQSYKDNQFFTDTQEKAATTGVEMAVNAYKEDNADWLKKALGGLRQNIYNYNRFFKKTKRGDEIASGWQSEIEAILAASDILGLPVFAKGGIVNFPASGKLAVMHGNEAVIPLDQGGNKVADAIFGSKFDALVGAVNTQNQLVAQGNAIAAAQLGAATGTPTPSMVEKGKLAAAQAQQQWKPAAKTLGPTVGKLAKAG